MFSFSYVKSNILKLVRDAYIDRITARYPDLAANFDLLTFC